MHQAGALLELEVVAAVDPDRKPFFQAELDQRGGDEVVPGGAGQVLGDQGVARLADDQRLLELVEHHGAAVRGGQRGDQPTVKAARVDAGQGAGGVAAQAVGNDPLGLERAPVAVGFAGQEGDGTCEQGCVSVGHEAAGTFAGVSRRAAAPGMRQPVSRMGEPTPVPP